MRPKGGRARAAHCGWEGWLFEERKESSADFLLTLLFVGTPLDHTAANIKERFFFPSYSVLEICLKIQSKMSLTIVLGVSVVVWESTGCPGTVYIDKNLPASAFQVQGLALSATTSGSRYFLIQLSCRSDLAMHFSFVLTVVFSLCMPELLI